MLPRSARGVRVLAQPSRCAASKILCRQFLYGTNPAACAAESGSSNSKLQAAAGSPFLLSLGQEAFTAMPSGVLDFHVSGGRCEGELVVTRGNLLGSLIATLGRLPAAGTGNVVVHSSSGECPSSG